MKKEAAVTHNFSRLDIRLPKKKKKEIGSTKEREKKGPFLPGRGPKLEGKQVYPR